VPAAPPTGPNAAAGEHSIVPSENCRPALEKSAIAVTVAMAEALVVSEEEEEEAAKRVSEAKCRAQGSAGPRVLHVPWQAMKKEATERFRCRHCPVDFVPVHWGV